MQADGSSPIVVRSPGVQPQSWALSDELTATLRQIGPEDAAIEQNFVRHLSEESRYYRFMNELRELTPQMLERFTRIDPANEMAFIVTVAPAGVETEIGVGRYIINPDRESCEFAVAVADDWQHHGIGSRLMRALMEHARARGLKRMDGYVLSANAKMLELMRELGFEIHASPGDPTTRIVSSQLQTN
jgi:acetyltransferase